MTCSPSNTGTGDADIAAALVGLDGDDTGIQWLTEGGLLAVRADRRRTDRAAGLTRSRPPTMDSCQQKSACFHRVDFVAQDELSLLLDFPRRGAANGDRLCEDGTPQAWVNFPPGNSADPDNPHISDTLDDWVQGVYTPLPFSRAEVDAATETTITLAP